jgi:site-specific DNA recombinase
VSGRLDDRPNLEDIVAQVERGELGGLVVAKVDRFSRDLAYGAMVARRIERAGGTFVAADDGVVLSPKGRDFGGNDAAHFLFAQLLSMSDFFGRRVTRSWHDTIDRHVFERGRHWGYAMPFGYRKGEDGRLEVDERWAPFVVEAFERRANGDGCSTIARWLDGQGRAPRAEAGPPIAG